MTIDRAIPYAEVLSRRSRAISTACVHAGGERDENGALETPIVLSSAFAFASAEEAAGAFRGDNDAFIYGRWANPTVLDLERTLATLEGAESACVAASGMAAIAGTLLSICDAGSHVVAPRAMYGESARLLRERLPRFGVTTTFVDGSIASYEAALRPETRVLYIETPSNPLLAISSVKALSALAHDRKLIAITDSTFATPFSLSPLELGCDLVVHSMTKGISGHGDVIAGLVCGSKAHTDRARDFVVKGIGAVLSPLSAMLVSRGVRTFALRQERACANAAELATRLATHKKIARVNHPSLESHEGHAVAQKEMHAYGGILSFELDGADAIARGRRVLEALRVCTHAVSLGDVRTLVVHPASTTHSTMPKDVRELAGIKDGLLRVSVGIESVEDLWKDLDAALSHA